MEEEAKRGSPDLAIDASPHTQELPERSRDLGERRPLPARLRALGGDPLPEPARAAPGGDGRQARVGAPPRSPPLRRAGARPAPRPAIVPPPGARELAARLLRRLGVPPGCPVAGIHPGAGGGSAGRSIASSRGGGARGARVAVLIFSGPAERALLLAMGPPDPGPLRAAHRRPGALDASHGDRSLHLRRLRPMHLAAALGVPCVTVFRIGDCARYRPLGAGDRVLYAAGGEVEPSAVLAAAADILPSLRPRWAPELLDLRHRDAQRWGWSAAGVPFPEGMGVVVT